MKASYVVKLIYVYYFLGIAVAISGDVKKEHCNFLSSYECRNNFDADDRPTMENLNSPIGYKFYSFINIAY